MKERKTMREKQNRPKSCNSLIRLWEEHGLFLWWTHPRFSPSSSSLPKKTLTSTALLPPYHISEVYFHISDPSSLSVVIWTSCFSHVNNKPQKHQLWKPVFIRHRFNYISLVNIQTQPFMNYKYVWWVWFDNMQTQKR